MPPSSERYVGYLYETIVIIRHWGLKISERCRLVQKLTEIISRKGIKTERRTRSMRKLWLWQRFRWFICTLNIKSIKDDKLFLWKQDYLCQVTSKSYLFILLLCWFEGLGVTQSRLNRDNGHARIHIISCKVAHTHTHIRNCKSAQDRVHENVVYRAP